MPVAEATQKAVRRFVFGFWSFVFSHDEGAGARHSPFIPVFTIFGIPAGLSTAVPIFLILFIRLVIP